MKNDVWIRNKNESERSPSLNLNSILFVDYLFVTLVLHQALEGAIGYETLISSCQKNISACERTIQKCDEIIKKYGENIRRASEEKSKASMLPQEFLATQVGKKMGDVPRTPREVSLRELFVTKQYKFIFLRGNESLPDELEKDRIYLKADIIGNAFFCTLKTDAKKPIQKHIMMGKLWYVSNVPEKEKFQGDLSTLSADNIAVFYISVLENLAKEGAIPNPYQAVLETYPQIVAGNENLIKNVQLKLQKEQDKKEQSMRLKEEYQAQLTLAQQELAMIKPQFEPIPSNQTTTPTLANPCYQLEMVQPRFFDSIENRHDPLAKKQDYQLEVVEPNFEGSRERREPFTENENFKFRK